MKTEQLLQALQKIAQKTATDGPSTPPEPTVPRAKKN
jgi:hypothetical protein